MQVLTIEGKTYQPIPSTIIIEDQCYRLEKVSPFASIRWIKERWKQIAIATSLCAFVMSIAGTLLFMCFIEQEAHQQMGMGIFMLWSNGAWQSAENQVDEFDSAVRFNLDSLTAKARLVPFFGKSFQRYAHFAQASWDRSASYIHHEAAKERKENRLFARKNK